MDGSCENRKTSKTLKQISWVHFEESKVIIPRSVAVALVAKCPSSIEQRLGLANITPRQLPSENWIGGSRKVCLWSFLTAQKKGIIHGRKWCWIFKKALKILIFLFFQCFL